MRKCAESRNRVCVSLKILVNYGVLFRITVSFGNVWLFVCTFAGAILSFLKYAKMHFVVRACSISESEIPARGMRARCLLGLY